MGASTLAQSYAFLFACDGCKKGGLVGYLIVLNVQDRSLHMSFKLKGSRNYSCSVVKGQFKSKTSIQEFKEGNTKLILKLVHELHGTCHQYNVKSS